MEVVTAEKDLIRVAEVELVDLVRKARKSKVRAGGRLCGGGSEKES